MKQARLPTIDPLSPDVEALLAYEREIALQLDIVRARALARARQTLQRSDVASTGRALVWNEHISMPVVVGVMVVAGLAAAIELFLSAGTQSTATGIEKLSAPAVERTSTSSATDAGRGP
jgi:hypothetical protein